MPNARRADTSQILVATLLALLLAACAAHRTPKPVTPPSKPKATTSAATDAPKYPQGNENIKQGPAKGSADALAPTEVGYYMDVLQGRLRQVAGIDVVRREDRIVVGVAGGCDFASGRAQADAGLRSAIAALAGVLTEYRKTLVSVRMRAADTSPDPQLAQRCAVAAAHSLVNAGLGAKRVVLPAAASAAAGSVPPEAPPAAAFVIALEFVVEPMTTADAH
jgi:hypothetical protein